MREADPVVSKRRATNKMNAELYLILHKVRGEPAFDIAICCDDMGTESDPGPWWIISTSGWRAYPYREWPLDLLEGPSFYPQHLAWAFGKGSILPDNWPSWPDHFTTIHAPRSPPALDLLAKLGLKEVGEPIKRRKL